MSTRSVHNAVAAMALSCVAGLPTIAVTVATSTLLPARTAHATPIDWVEVGDPGNANDTATGGLYGAVAYDYRIMKFEFTNSQYVAFLNAVDPDGTNPQDIWNSDMGSNARGGISFTSGSSAGSKYAVRTNMGDKPVNYVSWFDAARVANWLQNGAQTYGSTDSSATAPQNTGAYALGTATSGTVPAKSVGATYWVPTENEWYKAAFYNPTLNSGAGGYRAYGNGFDTTPGSVSANEFGVGSAGGTGNFANYVKGADWNSQDGNVTTVGTNGGANYYGAFDMSGNVWEWNALAGTGGSEIGARGGDWFGHLAVISAGFRPPNGSPAGEADVVGFRIAAVPEPSTWALAGIGIACAGWGACRRRRAKR